MQKAISINPSLCCCARGVALLLLCCSSASAVLCASAMLLAPLKLGVMSLYITVLEQNCGVKT